MCRKWKPGQLEDGLRAWAMEHGALNRVAMKAGTSALLRATEKKYGSLRSAARKLKLPYHSSRRILSKEEVVTAIVERARQGRSLVGGAVQKDDGPLFHGAVRHYGRWTAAVRHANVKYDPLEANRNWTPQRIVAALREQVRKHGALDQTVLRKENPSLHAVVMKRFNGVKNAAEKLGLPVTMRRRQHTPEGLLERLRERLREGKSLQSLRVLEEESWFHSAACLHFGNWRRALEAAGIDPREHEAGGRRWDKRKTAAALRAHARKFGGLATSEMHAHNRGLDRAAIRYFGSVRKAAEELGLPIKNLRKGISQSGPNADGL
jgi:molybdenum-dependent DNA-binding transcriptional regulator ModE